MKRVLLGSVTVLLNTIAITDRAMAQVVPDSTLGTQVTQTGAVFGINNGTRSGNNLFHSFSQFSVPPNGSAIFNNATDVQNIFSRVTGSQLSNIDGILKTQGGANLFLMNPNGIIFGPNAKLELGGSFIGTTASGIKFSDGIEFNTVNTTPALLSVNLPIGLQMGTNPGAINVNGTGHKLQLPSTYSPVIRSGPQPVGLKVKPNQTLALVGGNIKLNGGVLSSPQGRLEILSGANGNVSLTSASQGWQLNADSLQSYGDISLTNRSSLEASGAGNTAIQVVGKTIQILNGSIALMVTQGSQPPGSFQIKASEAFQLSGLDKSGKFGSFLINDVFAGTGAEMTIVAPKIMLSDTVMIHARAFGRSQLGNVAIKASTLQIDGQADRNPSIRTRISTSTLGQSNAGTLTISTDQLHLVNGGVISASNLGSGLGGDVNVVANTVKVDGVSFFPEQSTLLTVSALGSGNAGNLNIQTQVLSVTGGSTLNTSTLAGGNAGNLTINATRSVEVSGGVPLLNGTIDGSEIASAATVVSREVQQRLGLPPIPSGAAGSVTINTPLLSILNSGTIKVDNQGLGNAGTLRVNANDIYLKGGTIEAATAVGEGGDLFLQAQTLLLRDRSSITATAGGSGKGGNITIQSPIVVGLENSDIVANAVKGKGGSIQISTQSIFGLRYRDRLTSENDITASSEFGINGNVQVNTIGINPANALNELPSEVVDSSRQIADRCGAAKTSSFIATGRGGMPQSPMKKRGSDRPWNDLRTNEVQASAIVTPIAQNTSQPIVEASAIEFDEFGGIALTTPKNSAIQSATCGMAGSIGAL
jgi:filamentous hemagglutinin family protein